MSAAIMAPARTLTPPSGLSRSTATYFTSVSLPPASLPSWSLDHSCTTFGSIAAAAQHPRSTRLIDDDPDRAEEDHIRGIKRNHRAMGQSSPLKERSMPSKRRCYPFPMQIHSSKSREASEPSWAKPSNPDKKILLRPLSNKTRALSLTSLIMLSPTSTKQDRSQESEPSSEFHKIDMYKQNGRKSPVPEPPNFRRRSTIRDCFDLASSIEEFSKYF